MIIVSLIRKTFKHMLTERDNTTFDVVRISLFLSVVATIGLGTYAVIKTGAFDAMSFATGLAALVGGGGAGVGARAKMEDGTPKPPPELPMGRAEGEE